MQYRKFGKTNWHVSALSLGITELANLKDDDAVSVIRTAIDSGVNLIDVGWPLDIKGIEPLFTVLEKALKDGYRQKTKIAAAVPVMKINEPADFNLALVNLFRWLRADSVDFLLLGGLNRFTLPRLQNMEILKHAEQALADKKVGYLGFFFHDQYQFLRDTIRAYDNWSVCQLNYSFMDIDHHPGYGGLRYAADKGLGIMTSKPLLGGRLLKNLPPAVSRVWANAEPKRSPAEWALRWVWNHPEISTVVSDMNSAAQARENAALADSAAANSFSVPEELVVGKARDAYLALKPIPCTACRGCMPCPQSIDVPRIFEIFNDAVMYNDVETARLIYRMEHHELTACNDCGSCVCGKKIPIPQWVKKAQMLMEDIGKP